MHLLARGIVATTVLGCAMVTGAGQALAGDLDRFLSYRVRSATSPPDILVNLSDQFLNETFEVTRLLALLTPAATSPPAVIFPDGIFDPDTHLNSYGIRQATGGKFRGLQNVQVTNAFGAFIVDVRRPVRLLVPASKSIPPDDPLPPPEIGSIDVDHFLCYNVRQKGDRFRGQVLLADQFNPDFVLFDMRQPRRLCNPVDKNGEGIKHPESHLLCFTVRPARGEAPVEEVEGIVVNDQFRGGEVRTRRIEELCVPSTKTLPGGG